MRKISLNLQELDKNSFVSVWVTVGLSFTVMLYILFVLCDSWICCTLLHNIYSQTSICCECPQKIFCILTSILKAKIVNIQRQTTPGMQKRAFHLDVWGTKHLECSKTPKKKSTDDAVEKQLKPSVFLRLDGCFFPNFISVECVYSHSGLKEERKCKESIFLKDSTAFSVQSNYILNIIVIWLKYCPPCVVGLGSQSLSSSEWRFLGREQSKGFFSADWLHLVNDWIVQMEAL